MSIPTFYWCILNLIDTNPRYLHLTAFSPVSIRNSANVEWSCGLGDFGPGWYYINDAAVERANNHLLEQLAAPLREDEDTKKEKHPTPYMFYYKLINGTYKSPDRTESESSELPTSNQQVRVPPRELVAMRLCMRYKDVWVYMWIIRRHGRMCDDIWVYVWGTRKYMSMWNIRIDESMCEVYGCMRLCELSRCTRLNDSEV